MPKRYAVIMQNNKLKFEYRRIVINNYVIIYTISEKYRMVYVVHMYYGSMDYFDKIY